MRAHSANVLRLQLVVCLLVLLVLGTPDVHAETTLPKNNPAHKNVLVFFSYAEGFGGYDQISSGFFSALQEAKMSDIDVYVEKLDLGRFTTPAYRQALQQMLVTKYSQKKIDLLVTIQKPALDFVLQDAKSIFSNTPIISAIVQKDAYLSINTPQVVSLPYAADFGKTLEYSLSLFPKTRQVFFISGSYEADKLFEEEARRSFEPWQKKIAFTYLSGLT